VKAMAVKPMAVKPRRVKAMAAKAAPKPTISDEDAAQPSGPRIR